MSLRSQICRAIMETIVKNIMIFCSNYVNGGTARIFYETAMGLKKTNNYKIFPCINRGNKVEIYHKLEDLTELPITSAEQMFPDLFGGGHCKERL